MMGWPRDCPLSWCDRGKMDELHVLVDQYYDEDWTVCPKCGDDLTEVSR